jgi:hypothetical protein
MFFSCGGAFGSEIIVKSSSYGRNKADDARVAELKKLNDALSRPADQHKSLPSPETDQKN